MISWKVRMRLDDVWRIPIHIPIFDQHQHQSLPNFHSIHLIPLRGGCLCLLQQVLGTSVIKYYRTWHQTQ